MSMGNMAPSGEAASQPAQPPDSAASSTTPSSSTGLTVPPSASVAWHTLVRQVPPDRQSLSEVHSTQVPLLGSQTAVSPLQRPVLVALHWAQVPLAAHTGVAARRLHWVSAVQALHRPVPVVSHRGAAAEHWASSVQAWQRPTLALQCGV